MYSVIGDMHPVKVYDGETVIAQAIEQTQTGDSLTFDGTYNDEVLSAEVKGDTAQQSEWVHKQGLLSQFTGVAGTNLVANGNFANGTNSWYGSGANITASGNELTAIPTVETPNISTVRQDLSVVSGNKYYISASVKASYTDVFVALFDGITVHVSPPHSGSGNYERLSALVTSGNTTTAAHMQIIRDQSSGTRQPSYAKNGIIINLTAAFGAGNEPTVAQVDAMLSQHPNSWFDGKGNLTTSTSYTANSPSPAYPQPLISNLPAGTYKTQDYKGDWYEFTLTENLKGINEFKDLIAWDKYSHNGFIKHAIKKTLVKNLSWQAYSDVSGFGRFETNIIADKYHSGQHTTNLLCTHLTVVKYYTVTYQAWRIAERDSYNNLRIMVPAGTSLSQMLEIVGDAEIYYPLATSNRTSLTFTLNNDSTAPELPMEFLTGTPSPEYPAELHDAEGEIVVRGRNLFNAAQWSTPSTTAGVTVQYLSSEDCFVINGTSTRKGDVAAKDINLFGSKNSGYSLSTKYVSGTVHRPNGTGFAVAYFGSADTINTHLNWDAVGLYEYDNSKQNRVLPHDYITRFWFYIAAGVTFNNYKVRIQLEHSATAHPYEPYREHQTVTTPTLRSLPDGTKDEWNVLTGEVTRRIAVKTLNGTETWDKYQNAFRTRILDATGQDDQNIAGNVYCTHFVPKSYSDVFSRTNNGIALRISSVSGVAINYMQATIVDEFKTWLAAEYANGTPVTIHYKLAEPVIENITPQPLRTYPKTTVIETHNDTIAELETTATVRIFDKT